MTERTANVIPAERLVAKRRERERQRRESEALVGSILEGCASESEQRVCGVASEPIGDTAKWLKRILTP
jgi:hypothetical protein